MQYHTSFTLTILTLAWLTLSSCGASTAPEIPEKVLDVMQPDERFAAADQLRYAQDYAAAATAYAALLAAPGLDAMDSLYLLNQLHYCDLIRNQTDIQLEMARQLAARIADLPKSLLADHYFNLGRYYLAVVGDRERTMEHYHNFLQAKADDPNVDYTLLAESYYVLREAHRSLGAYDRSADYAKKSFQLYGCLNDEVAIDHPDATRQLDSTKLYCLTTSGFFAADLLRKYQAEGNLEDLHLANTYFDFVERHSFKSLLHTDEDDKTVVIP